MSPKEDDFGYCDLHEDTVSEAQYEWKGCWNCYHFSSDTTFPFINVSETALELGKSPSTVVRWLNKGKLQGRLFKQGRPSYGMVQVIKKYHITKDSVAKLKGVKL